MFRRTVDLGKVAYSGKRKINRVTLTLEIRPENYGTRMDWDTLRIIHNRLCVSVCGAIWNGPGTDHVSGGQNIDTVAKLVGGRRVRRIRELWSEWHLNTGQSGTRSQTEALDANRLMMTSGEREAFDRDHYTNSCAFLRSVGLYEDRGFRYGHGWLVKPLPLSVEIELRELFTGDGTFRTSAEWVAALEADRDNPTLRAVYADWLDDQGQHVLANDQREIAKSSGILI